MVYTIISFKSLHNLEGGHDYNSNFINEETEAHRGWGARFPSKKEEGNEDILLTIQKLLWIRNFHSSSCQDGIMESTNNNGQNIWNNGFKILEHQATKYSDLWRMQNIRSRPKDCIA